MKRTSLALASALLVVAALVFLAPLALDWIFFSGRAWPRMHLEGLQTAAVVLFAAVQLATVAALAAMLRRAFGVWRAGAALWALAATATGLWPLVALLPAARRLGNRPAARFAAAGGAALLAAAASGAVARWTGLALFWPAFALAALGTALVLAALAAFSGTPRAFRPFGVAFAAMLVASLASQPSFRAGRYQREADARLLAVLERTGSPIRPGAPFPGAVPPVAEADDPVAAVDAGTLEADKASFHELRGMIVELEEPDPDDADGVAGDFRRHPLVPEESAAFAAWLASHPNLAAVAEAVSAPGGYRSCLPGLETAADIDARTDKVALEPRLFDCLHLANFLSFRAKVRLAAGDAAAAADDVRRIDRLAALADREPTMIGGIVAGALRQMRRSLLSARIDRWPDDVLDAFARDAERDADLAERDWKRYVAGELVFMDATLRSLPEDAVPSFDFRQPRDLGGLARLFLRYWFARERLAFLDFAETEMDAIDAALALPPGPERAAAFDALLESEKRRAAVLPPGAALFAGSWSFFFVERQNGFRTAADFVRAAVAVEKWRRAHGGETPPSLDALVEAGLLRDLPRDARTGEPLAYDPGPLRVPEEFVRRLADPDAVACQEQDWLAGTPAGDVLRERLGDEPEPQDYSADPRRLPAQTLPGFRLEMKKAGSIVDFPVTRSPASDESHAESAEGAKEPAP